MLPNLFFSPNEFPINELQPATIPILYEIIIKYKGKDLLKQPKLLEKSFPA